MLASNTTEHHDAVPQDGTVTDPAANTAPHTAPHKATKAAVPAERGSEPDRGGGLLRRLLPAMIRDVGAPTAAYYLLHLLGVGDWAALLVGALVSGGLLIGEAVRTRRLEIFSGFMLGVFTIGLIGALVSGDPRFLIVKDSFGTALFGLAFLVSTAIGRPLVYYAARRFAAPRVVEEMEQAYATVPGVRRTLRSMSLIWGFGLLGEAIVRIPLAYSLPVSTMAALSNVLMIGTIIILTGITVLLQRRAERAGEQGAAGQSSQAQPWPDRIN
ncbi:MAG TPA: VC0807 family protein [Pseudonocardiaceae bacterium]